ncbi:MAG: hypothetical protein ACI8TP_000509 [Acidimicrobiales bacterium]|jgi:hypothetical protein
MSTSSRISATLEKELASIMWDYQAALRRIETLLEAHLLFSRSGAEHRLATVADIIDETATMVGVIDLRREVAMCRLVEPGESGATMSDLVEMLSEPWSTVFADHQRTMTQTVDRLQTLVSQNRASMDATINLIAQLIEEPGNVRDGGYDQSGQVLRASTQSVFFDGLA